MAVASPCRSARRKSGEKRPRVTFNETAQCVLFRRGPGFDTLPADGGISLALDDFVSYHYEPLSLNVDETHGAGTPRRHPTRRREEQLAKMPPSEREALLQPPDETVRACLLENQSILRAHADQSKFCTCVGGCDTESCACARDGIGCHQEGSTGCRCRKGCRNPLGLARYDAPQLRRDRKRALMEYTRREIEVVSGSSLCTPSDVCDTSTPLLSADSAFSESAASLAPSTPTRTRTAGTPKRAGRAHAKRVSLRAAVPADGVSPDQDPAATASSVPCAAPAVSAPPSTPAIEMTSELTPSMNTEQPPPTSAYAASCFATPAREQPCQQTTVSVPSSDFVLPSPARATPSRAWASPRRWVCGMLSD